MAGLIPPKIAAAYGHRAQEEGALGRARSLLRGASGKGKELTRAQRERRLREACASFEAIFVHQLLKEMRRSIPPDPFFGKSLQRDIYTSMFDMELANKVAHGKGLGIGELLYRELSRTVRTNKH